MQDQASSSRRQSNCTLRVPTLLGRDAKPSWHGKGMPATCCSLSRCQSAAITVSDNMMTNSSLHDRTDTTKYVVSPLAGRSSTQTGGCCAVTLLLTGNYGIMHWDYKFKENAAGVAVVQSTGIPEGLRFLARYLRTESAIRPCHDRTYTLLGALSFCSDPLMLLPAAARHAWGGGGATSAGLPAIQPPELALSAGHGLQRPPGVHFCCRVPQRYPHTSISTQRHMRVSYKGVCRKKAGCNPPPPPPCPPAQEERGNRIGLIPCHPEPLPCHCMLLVRGSGLHSPNLAMGTALGYAAPACRVV